MTKSTSLPSDCGDFHAPSPGLPQHQARSCKAHEKQTEITRREGSEAPEIIIDAGNPALGKTL